MLRVKVLNVLQGVAVVCLWHRLPLLELFFPWVLIDSLEPVIIVLLKLGSTFGVRLTFRLFLFARRYIFRQSLQTQPGNLFGSLELQHLNIRILLQVLVTVICVKAVDFGAIILPLRLFWWLVSIFFGNLRHNLVKTISAYCLDSFLLVKLVDRNSFVL